MGCKAFISTPLEIKGAALANVFHEVKVNLVSAEAERICIDRMVKGQEEPFASPEGLAEVDSRMASLVSFFFLHCLNFVFRCFRVYIIFGVFSCLDCCFFVLMPEFLTSGVYCLFFGVVVGTTVSFFLASRGCQW